MAVQDRPSRSKTDRMVSLGHLRMELGSAEIHQNSGIVQQQMSVSLQQHFFVFITMGTRFRKYQIKTYLLLFSANQARRFDQIL